MCLGALLVRVYRGRLCMDVCVCLWGVSVEVSVYVSVCVSVGVFVSCGETALGVLSAVDESV